MVLHQTATRMARSGNRRFTTAEAALRSISPDVPDYAFVLGFNPWMGDKPWWDFPPFRGQLDSS